MKYLFLITIPIISFWFHISSALAADATELSIRLYSFAVSTNDDCSNLTSVIDNGSNPSPVNLISADGAVNLGVGRIPIGTYPCVVIEMSDHIRFQTASSSGGCTADTDQEYDVCENPQAPSNTLSDGTTVTCADSEQRIALRLTTDQGQASTDWTWIISNPLEVTEAAAGKFIVPSVSAIDDSNNNACVFSRPDFDFSQFIP